MKISNGARSTRKHFSRHRKLWKNIFKRTTTAPLCCTRKHGIRVLLALLHPGSSSGYYRPTIMMTTVDGVAKGSARSISGFNIHEALKRCEDKLIQFGGHKYAAGLTVELDRLDEFRDAFKQVAAELLTEDLLTPEIKIDAEVQLSDLTPKFIRVLTQFAPFGPENMRPVFAARGVEVPRAAQDRREKSSPLQSAQQHARRGCDWI